MSITLLQVWALVPVFVYMNTFINIIYYYSKTPSPGCVVPINYNV